MKPEKERALIIVIIAVNLIITLALSFVLNIWIDEMYTLDTTGKGPAYAFKQAIFFEQQAPLYFVLLSLWRFLFTSIIFFRLFSVICISISLLVIWKLSKCLLPSVSPFWIVSVFAFNPFMIWAATEIRLYALGILLSALLLLAYYLFFVQEHRSHGRWVLYFMIITAALATHYYFLFVFAAFGAGLLVNRKWPLLKPFLIVHALSLFALLPMLRYVPHQIKANLGTIREVPTFLYSAKLIAGGLRRFLLPLDYLPKAAGFLLLSVIALFVFSRMLHQPLSMTLSQRTLWSIFSVLFLFYLIVAHYSGSYLTRGRYLFPSFLLTIFCFYSISDFFKIRLRPTVVFIATMALLVLYVPALFRGFSPLAKDGDYIRVSAFIEKNEKPQQPIFVFTPAAAITLGYYYSGKNAIIPIPEKMDFSKYDLAKFVVKNEAQITDFLSRNYPDAEGFWLLRTSHEIYLDVDLRIGVLKSYLDAHHKNELSKIFYESKLDFYKVR